MDQLQTIWTNNWNIQNFVGAQVGLRIVSDPLPGGAPAVVQDEVTEGQYWVLHNVAEPFVQVGRREVLIRTGNGRIPLDSSLLGVKDITGHLWTNLRIVEL